MADDDSRGEGERVEADGTWTAGEEKPAAVRGGAGDAPPGRRAEAVDDFLRSFLLGAGMAGTLDCFERERYGMTRRGAGGAEEAVPEEAVPDVYAEYQRLDNELRAARRERDEYERAASAASETLAELQRARDARRRRYQRVVQERDRLIECVRKLRSQRAGHEPGMTQTRDTCQTAWKRKMRVGLERDEAEGHADGLLVALHGMSMQEGGSDTQQTRGGRCVAEKPSQTAPRFKPAQDSDLPAGPRPTNLPAQTRDQSLDANAPIKAKAGSFCLSTTFKAHSQSVSCLATHPSKPLVASSSRDQLWKLWGIPEGDPVATGEGHTTWLSGISFHPDKTKLGTTGGDGNLCIWDLSIGYLVLSLQGHTAATWGCSFHSCGHFVASCSMDCTIKVWDLQSERCRSTLRGHNGSVNSVEFLPSSNVLLTSSADKTLSLWDARAALCAQTLCGHTSSCNHATFASAGKVIASCDSCGIVMFWDVRNLVAPTLVMETGPKPSNQLAFSPRGHMLAVAGEDNLVRVLDLVTNQVGCTLSHDDAVQSVVFDHKGEHLLSAASDGQIYVWS
ncbi:sperm-associated antigen 16 protein-like [Lampris incognitus]|uniref:sperm-associated antigen 16 protein-like n=1 Tax=Lampris incognitus TaxID=2546036 RepID=UPI0024B529CA|nr:sperm-associated antigen 16 protein-like [Lampris incognitus]